MIGLRIIFQDVTCLPTTEKTEDPLNRPHTETLKLQDKKRPISVDASMKQKLPGTKEFLEELAGAERGPMTETNEDKAAAAVTATCLEDPGHLLILLEQVTGVTMVGISNH